MTTDELDHDAQAIDAIPVATALVCAVEAEDRAEVAQILTSLDVNGLYALCVVLAGHVSADQPLVRYTATGNPIAAASMTAAALFRLPMEHMRGGESRRREVLDARAVAIYAARLVDPGIGWTTMARYVGRDHSTVMHNHARVGADARLKRIAERIADQIGRPEMLDDLGEGTG